MHTPTRLQFMSCLRVKINKCSFESRSYINLNSNGDFTFKPVYRTVWITHPVHRKNIYAYLQIWENREENDANKQVYFLTLILLSF